jgi:hypothetical protein
MNLKKQSINLNPTIMKTITLLISAIFLLFFVGEVQSQNSSFAKLKIDKQITKKEAVFIPNAYCAASGGCDEYVTLVQMGFINNSSYCSNYNDVTWVSTDIPLNGFDIVTVTNGNPYAPDECGIWVDWNQDDDFLDTGESFTVTGSPGEGPYTATIAPPPGALLGETVMRIRITYNTTPTPCGTDTYGEVEDYTVNVVPKVPNEWVGAVNSDWHYYYNWSLNHVPTADEDVIITNNGWTASLYSGDAECNNLTINTGGELDVNDKILTVNGDVIISGQLTMSDGNGSLYCYGNVDWNNNSTANITAYTNIYVEGHWFFNTGANAQLGNSTVHLVGTQDCEIKCKSPTCSLNDLYLGKSTTAKTSIAADANYPFVINGYLIIQTSDNFFENSTDQDIIVRKNFLNSGGFDFSVGNNNSTFIFDGTDQTINMVSANGKFNNIKFSPSSGFTMGPWVEAAGDITIESGILYGGHYTISLGGDWINNVGPNAFDEGTSRVVFNGDNIQWCSYEVFNELEINNPPGALYISGSDVVCAAYDWTAGSITVFNGGSFTANDLIDEGLFGTYVVTDGTINVTNNDGYVDLNGAVNIHDGGTMNVYGGTTASYWPYAADATINMDGGVLDFHDQGIYIWNTGYDLSENIIGGIIRTAGGFRGERSDFTPSAGTFEFYGSNDYYMSQSNGCTLYDVNINKSSKKGSSVSTGIPVIDERSKKVLSDGGKSNMITLDSDFHITNDLTITSGHLRLNGYELTVDINADVYGTLTLDEAMDILNVGQTYMNELHFYTGSSGNFTNGTANIYAYVITDAGCSFTATTNNTVVFKGSGGGIENHEASTVFGNIGILINAGYTAYISSLNDQAVSVNGNFTINNGSFDLNGNELECFGNVDVNNGGNMSIGENSTLKLDNGSVLAVNPGGEIEVVGSAGNEAIITHVNSGSYTFNVMGTISAKNAIFEYMDTYGVLINVGATVDPLFPFDDCVFRNGAPSPSSLLIVNNNQDFTCQNTRFENTSGNTGHNVWKLVDEGHVTFTNAEGLFAGPAYEKDPYDRIDWPGYVPGLWTGMVSSNWFNNQNWSDYRVPVDTSNVIIPASVPNYPLITGANDSCYSITIDAGASLEIGNGRLDLGAFGIIDIYGELIMHDANGILSASGISWEAGSTDDIDNGKIYTAYWGFLDGTNAQLGTGNTAHISYGLDNFDENASFGNLMLSHTNKKNLKGKTGHPILVSGNFLVEQGGSWASNVSFYIEGNWEIETGASMEFASGVETSSYCQDLILNGTLDFETNAGLDVHGSFEFATSGKLIVQNDSFVCDYSPPSGWIDLNGDITLTTGTLEFTSANVNFAGTSSISGGTIRIGGSMASTSANSFNPTGGTVEMIGNGTGHYFQLTNGNYLYNLVINRTSEIQIYENSLLDIHADLTVNSELTTDLNDVIVYGNVDINNGGYLEIGPGSSLQMFDASSLTVNNGGTFAALGNAGSKALITDFGLAGYDFDVNAGGTISADNAIFEYMENPSGINVSNGAIIDPVNCFNNCTFRNGTSPAFMSTYLTINNAQTLTIHNASFPIAGLDYNVLKENTLGLITFVDYSGAFSGAAYEFDPYNLIDWVVPVFDLDLKVFLEGPFAVSNMATNLTDIPLSQPYNTSPWNYTGTESVPSIPNANVVDWVLVELRDASSPGGASSSARLARQAAFILKDGSVVGTDGSSVLQFNVSVNNNLYAIVWHRNHLGIMSASALTESGGVYVYNFTTAVNKAYLSGQKALNGKAAMFGGDADANGTVNTTDKSLWSGVAGAKAYLSSDMNMDEQVDNKDKNDLTIPNFGEYSRVPN